MADGNELLKAIQQMGPKQILDPFKHPMLEKATLGDETTRLMQVYNARQEMARKAAQQEAIDRLNRERFHADLAQANTAKEFCRRLTEYIIQFEQQLKATEEVGLCLVSFGQAELFHVRDLGYYDPSLVQFIGETTEGKPVWLVQHVSNISFLLKAVPRMNPEEPRQEMGYHTLLKQFQQEEAAAETAEEQPCDGEAEETIP